jgi:hypothetical protein
VVGELLADGTAAPPLGSPARGLAVTPVEPPLLDAVTRLVALLGSPQDIVPLAPLVLREITYRVLTGPQGLRLRQIAAAGAPAHRIARAIRWLKDHLQGDNRPGAAAGRRAGGAGEEGASAVLLTGNADALERNAGRRSRPLRAARGAGGRRRTGDGGVG